LFRGEFSWRWRSPSEPAGLILRTYESANRFEPKPPVEQHRNHAPDRFYGHTDIRLGPKFPSIVKTQDSARRDLFAKPAGNPFGFQLPIIADYRPHDAGKFQPPLRFAHSGPAHAERRAKQLRKRTGMHSDGLLRPPEILMDKAWRL